MNLEPSFFEDYNAVMAMHPYSSERSSTYPSVLVIGLGYVGLPVAALVASTGQYQVTGFDLDKDKIKAIEAGAPSWVDNDTRHHLANASLSLSVTADPTTLTKYDFIVLCVPTPVNEQDLPDLGPVMAATKTAAKHLNDQGVIILESTVNPGVSEEVLIPLLAKQGLTVGQDAFLAHCPERIDPGNQRFPLAQIPRVLGADSPTGLAKATTFYESFLTAPIKPVSSLRAAEASKIVENAFRDINIAFVNELAQSFAHFDLDVVEVIEAASTKPFSFLAHYPGCGVGGHCIPVDPYYLIESAQVKGFEHRFLKLAREINRGMPAYTVELLKQGLADVGLWPTELPNDLPADTTHPTIAVLGISYKAGIGDERNSPAGEIWELAQQDQTLQGLTLERFDPFVPHKSTVTSLEELRRNPAVQVIIIATNHSEFIDSLVNQDWPHLKLIIDGRNCLPKWPRQAKYMGIGR